MLLLVTGFVLILLMSFGLIVYVTMPTKEAKLIDERLASLNASGGAGTVGSFPGSQLLKTNVGSESEWAQILIRRLKFARRISLLIAQSNVQTSVSQVTMLMAALAISGFIVAHVFLDMYVAAAIVGIVLALIPIGYLSFKRSKRFSAFDAELSNCVDMMSNALRAGHSVVGAIGILAEQAVEPAKTEWREVFAQQNFGIPMRDALLELLERMPSADLRVVVTAILVQREIGGNLGEILDRTVFVIRERVRIQGEIKVQTAQGRITGWVLTMLPLVMLLVINVINPGYSHVLFVTPTGHKLIYIGIGLLTLGALTIRHIINKIEV